MSTSLSVYHDKGSGLAWQTVESPYVYESGQWKHCHTVSIYQNGQWNQVHKSAIGSYTAQTPLNYTSVGTHSYTVPQGTRYLKVLVRGAGGGGSGGIGIYYSAASCSDQNNYQVSKAAGGTGGLARKIEAIIEVVPTQTFSITVGQGGSGGAGVVKRILANMSSTEVSVSSNSPYSSDYFYSTGGGNGSATRVQSSLGAVDIRANGGNGGQARRGRMSSHTPIFCQNPANYLWPGSPEITQGSSGANGTATVTGTDVGLNSILSLVTTSTNESGTGGSGGSTGDYRVLTNNSPAGDVGDGSSGSNGYVTITPYSV